MSHPAKAVANAFLELANSDGAEIDPLKLQKLVYYAHGWCLGLRGEPLIDEYLRAWQYGPVILSVYLEFQGFGAGPITRRAREYGPTGALYTPRVPKDDSWTWALIRRVWDQYGPFSSLRLSAMSHTPGGPWERSRRGVPPQADVPISNLVIETYFRELGRPSSPSSPSDLPQDHLL